MDRRSRGSSRRPSRSASDLAQLRAGRLRIGTFPTVGASLLPLAVTDFRDRYPEVALTVRSARFQALQQMLEADEVELSLLWDYAWQQVDDENLEVTHLLDDPPMLLISTVHHPARRPRVDLAELAGKQWITRPTCRPHLRRRLAGLTPEDRVSVLGPCSRRKTGRICRWIGRPSFLEIAMLFRIAVAAAASVALLPVAVSQADTASTVRFASVQYNSPGRHPHQRRPQRREGQDPQLRTTTRILTGWTVRDISRHVYTFPTFKLRAGTSVLKNPRDVTIDTCRWGNGPGFTRC